MRNILIFCLIVAFSGCSSTKIGREVKPITDKTEVAGETPKILTLVFEITDKDTVTIIDTSLLPGWIRENAVDQYFPQDGDLSLTISDEYGSNLYSVTIANPLEISVEYSDDYINLSSKRVKLEKAYFSLRVSYSDGMATVSIEKITDSSKFESIRLKYITLKNLRL